MSRYTVRVVMPGQLRDLAHRHARLAAAPRVEDRRHAQQPRQPVALAADAVVDPVVPAAPVVWLGHGVVRWRRGGSGPTTSRSRSPRRGAPPSMPAISIASRLCVALRLEPQYATDWPLGGAERLVAGAQGLRGQEAAVGPEVSDERSVHGAGDVARPRVDRLGLAAIAFGGARVEQERPPIMAATSSVPTRSSAGSPAVQVGGGWPGTAVVRSWPASVQAPIPPSSTAHSPAGRSGDTATTAAPRCCRRRRRRRPPRARRRCPPDRGRGQLVGGR